MSEKLRVILTGATGMVGEGVLIVCLKNPLVESVLLVNRKPCLLIHPKLKEIIHQDFSIYFNDCIKILLIILSNMMS